MEETNGPLRLKRRRKVVEPTYSQIPYSKARSDIKSLACEEKHGISGTARRNESRGWRTQGQEPGGLPESALDNVGSDCERRAALGDLERGEWLSQTGASDRLLCALERTL